MVRECPRVCQKKKKYLLKKNCKKQSGSWDCVTDTAGLDGVDYLSLETESLSALGGGDAFHPRASSRMRPPLAFTCKSLRASEASTSPVSNLPRASAAALSAEPFFPSEEGFPPAPCPFFFLPLNQDHWMKANQRELVPSTPLSSVPCRPELKVMLRESLS